MNTCLKVAAGTLLGSGSVFRSTGLILTDFQEKPQIRNFFFFFGVNFSSLKVRTGVLFLILNIGQTKIEHLIVRFSSRMTKNSR